MNCQLLSGKAIACNDCPEIKECTETRDFEEALYIIDDVEEFSVEKYFDSQAAVLDEIFSHDVFCSSRRGTEEAYDREYRESELADLALRDDGLRQQFWVNDVPVDNACEKCDDYLDESGNARCDDCRNCPF